MERLEFWCIWRRWWWWWFWVHAQDKWFTTDSDLHVRSVASLTWIHPQLLRSKTQTRATERYRSVKKTLFWVCRRTADTLVLVTLIILCQPSSACSPHLTYTYQTILLHALHDFLFYLVQLFHKCFRAQKLCCDNMPVCSRAQHQLIAPELIC